MGPGGVFVVVGSGLYAAVEDADEAVAERSERLMMEVAAGASVVLEGAAAGAGGDRTECPVIDRVVEAAVANVPCEHGTFLAGRDGER